MSEAFKIAIDFAVIAAIYILWLFPKWKRMGNPVTVTHTLMYLYIAGVLYFTLMPVITAIPFIINHPYVPMNLNPFGDLIAGQGRAILQIALNVTMMIPFGLLLPLCRKSKSKKCGILFCILCTFGFSLFIELIQPLLSGFRASDVTDLITNTSGGLLGYLCYLVFRPIAYRLVGIKTSKQSR